MLISAHINSKNGCYVNTGAQDLIFDTISHILYDRGTTCSTLASVLKVSMRLLVLNHAENLWVA